MRWALRWLVGSVCSVFFAAIVHGTETFSELTSKIFADKADLFRCSRISRGLDNAIVEIDPVLDTTVKEILTALKSRDKDVLLKRFHPKLGINKSRVETIFIGFDETYGSKTDISLLRVWALQSPNGQPKRIPCADDKIEIFTHYGFPLQFSVWMQIRGEKELGRIFFSLVPGPNKSWQIALWHSQQWTHLGMDAEAWAADASKDVEAKRIETAYLKYDLAAKLSDGQGHYLLSEHQQDVIARDRIYASADIFRDQLAKILNVKNLAYVNSIFARDGVGILLRFKLEAKEKPPELKVFCSKLAKDLYRNIKGANLGGINCGFLEAHEKPSADGRLGARFFEKNAVKR